MTVAAQNDISSGDHVESPTTPSKNADRKEKRFKPWRGYSILGLVLVALPILWFILAYGTLPRLWSHHEHKKIGERDQIQSYTAQDIPGDPIGLRLKGSEAAITCAFKRAGWNVADPVNLRSAMKIASSVVLQTPYPTAPVSPLFVEDRKQDAAFEKDEGKSADKRHHVRIWQIGKDDWYAAATFDKGVGLSLYTLQITHHIGPNVDAERDGVGRLLIESGARSNGTEMSRITPYAPHRNGGGDPYRTDGKIFVYALPEGRC